MKRMLLLLVAVGVLGAAFMASTANAAVGIQKWESLTCKSNEDLPEITEFEDFKKLAEAPEVGYEPLAEPAGHCQGGNAGRRNHFTGSLTAEEDRSGETPAGYQPGDS